MSQLVNSQLTPVNLFLDSRQANYLSEEGSTAIFDLQGNDLEMQHSEARTASVSLYQFHAANTIYNITETCNTLEFYTKFVDINGLEQQSSTKVVKIPIGYYNITNLMSVLNQKIYFAQLGSTTYSSSVNSMPIETTSHAEGGPTIVNTYRYYPGLLGQQFTSKYIAAVCIDNFTTSQNYINASGAQSSFEDSSFRATNKVKFCTPVIDDLSGINVQKTYKHFYAGVYLISSNFPGLLAKLGFPFSASYTLPIKSGFRGFGINLNMKITSPSNSNSTHYCNVSYEVQNPTKNVYLDNTQFPKNTLVGTSNIEYFSVGTLLANSWLELDYPRSIYVSIDSIITRNRCSNSKFPFGSIFARVPTANTIGNATEFGSIICYEPNTTHEILVPGLNMDQITIRLYDETGNAIDWNGGHWAMTLTVKHNIDIGSSGMEDSSLGRTYRPYLQGTDHDQLQTKNEFHHKKIRHI